MCHDTLIRLSDVSIAYDAKTIVRNFSLDIRERDFIVLRGKNGGGKTSLLKLLVGLLAPQSGTVQRAEQLSLGYLPQYRTIDRQFPITVLQTVASGLQSQLRWWQPLRKVHRQRALHQLQSLGLDDLAARPIHTLSGGQWQRTLLARALVSQPQILLLDEPDTHLDAAAKRALYDTLLRERDHRAIVLVTHDQQFPYPPTAKIVEVGQ